VAAAGGVGRDSVGLVGRAGRGSEGLVKEVGVVDFDLSWSEDGVV